MKAQTYQHRKKMPRGKKAVAATDAPSAPIQKKKRAKSAYSFFMAEFRGTDEMKDVSLGEMSTKTSLAWKALTDKSKYEEMAANANQDTERDLPPKPKKAPSGFIRFSMQYRGTLKEEDPKIGFKEMSERCGAAWRALSQEEKDAWKVAQD